MQALLFIAMFSFLFSVVGGIIASAGGNTKQLTQLRTAQTTKLFSDIDTVVNDTTRNKLRAVPVSTTDFIAYMRATPELSQLTDGHWPDTAQDSWGNTIQSLMATEMRVLYTNGSNQVTAPVTAVALISPGPDRTLQTIIPTTVTVASLQGVIQPTGSDDIVRVFTDEPAQRENWVGVQTRLEKIASAERRYYQLQIMDYRALLLDRYLQEIKTDGVATVPDITETMRNDPNGPRFLDLSVNTNRFLLGIDEEFNAIERSYPGSGNLSLTSVENADHSITLYLANSAGAPTPWTTLNYSITIKGEL